MTATGGGPAPLHRLHSAPELVDALLRLSDVLSAARSPDEIAAAVPDLARLTLDADHAVVGLREPDGRHLRLEVAPAPAGAPQRRPARVPLSLASPATDTAREGRATSFATDRHAARAYPHLAEELARAGLATTVHVPLRAGDALLGVLGLGWARQRVLRARERQVIASLAGSTGQALGLLRLLADRRSVAETLQRSLLTDLPPRAGLELSARYTPAARGEQVGGDWYDAVALPDGATALTIGDVSGHDMAAAAVMGQMRGLLRAYVWDRQDPPSDVVRRFDTALAGLHVGGVASLVLARIEDVSSRPGGGGPMVRWTNAGHPPPVLLLPDGSTRVLGGVPELLVGLDAGTGRSDHVQPLPPGSTLLLYTDGLIEHRGRTLISGLDDLRAALARHRDAPLDDMLDALLAEVVGPEPEDDCAMVAVRVRGA